MPQHLLMIIEKEVQAPVPSEVFSEFLQTETYSQELCRKLCDIAQGSAEKSWEVRRLATLMLERQCFKIRPDDSQAYQTVFALLGLLSLTDTDLRLPPSVRREGFTATALADFILEFRKKLERNQRIYDRSLTTERALFDFLHHAQQECHLLLGRYVFTPEEVVQRIRTHVRLTRGAQVLQSTSKSANEPVPEPAQPSAHAPGLAAEAESRLCQLPDFEAAIFSALGDEASVYWVSQKTSSALNALVEYPLTSIVLVVKPPGSDIEFELKRSGLRGPQPFSVVFTRDGKQVPTTHRFQGGSIGWLLEREASTSALFIQLYRLVHQHEAPLSMMLSVSTIHAVPRPTGEAHIVDYFTDPTVFGPGFDAMRTAMSESIPAFHADWRWRPPTFAEEPDLPGEVGDALKQSLEFLTLISPKQGILVGTSSFRLDRLAVYLSPDGPQAYFTDGLHRDYTADDARRFADTLLDELLGVYHPPPVAYRSHAEYVAAAFAVPHNRHRANQVYASILEQIGTTWGTLLALGGFSKGESFVARNVGIKSRWEKGAWTAKIIFMDHDDLTLPRQGEPDFHPHAALAGMSVDALYIRGDQLEPQYTESEICVLQHLYHIDPQRRQAGEAQFQATLARTYKKTKTVLATTPHLQQFFDASFLKQWQDWDALVRRFLACERDPTQLQHWQVETQTLLHAKGYPQELITEYVDAIEEHTSLLERYAFLYESV